MLRWRLHRFAFYLSVFQVGKVVAHVAISSDVADGGLRRALLRTDGHDGVRLESSASGGALFQEEESSIRVRESTHSGAVPTQNGVFVHAAGDTMCDNCGDVYYEIDGSGNAWALVMKLSKNEFCYGSSKWTSLTAFGASHLNARVIPTEGQYDAKSLAFSHLQGVKKILIESNHGNTATLLFAGTSTPRTLLTTNTVAFSQYPDFDLWKSVFDPGTTYQKAAMFMRGGMSVQDPPPVCRSANYDVQGSGLPCTLCFYASSGTGCPVAGGPEDVAIGIGLHADLDSAKCSTATNYTASGASRLLIWAVVDKQELDAFDQASI